MCTSSFPNHKALHRCIGFIVAIAIASSFALTHVKICVFPVVPQTQISNDLLENQTQIEELVDSFYIQLQVHHIVIFAFSIVMIIIAFVNIAPKNDELKFGFHFLGIIIMASIAMLCFYSVYVAFHLPCYDVAFMSEDGQQSTKESRIKKGIKVVNRKEKIGVNIYNFEDLEMRVVSTLDTFSGIFLLISTFIFCLDARVHAMQDEYVVRPDPRRGY